MNNIKEMTEAYLKEQKDGIEYYQLKLLASEVSGVKTTNEKVAEYVINHLNNDYQFVMKAEDVGNDLGITRTRVSRALQILSEGETPFLTRIGKSCYQVNSEVLKGIEAYNKSSEVILKG